MKNILLFIFLLCISNIQAQQTSIQGTVTNEENAPIEYFDAIVRDVKDSSMVQGDAFMDGNKTGKIYTATFKCRIYNKVSEFQYKKA